MYFTDGKLPNIEISNETTFPDEYFTCTSICRACDSRCNLFMNHANHENGSKEHLTDKRCAFKSKYDNKVYVCLNCLKQKNIRKVVYPKTISEQDNTWFGLARYAWSG